MSKKHTLTYVCQGCHEVHETVNFSAKPTLKKFCYDCRTEMKRKLAREAARIRRAKNKPAQ